MTKLEKPYSIITATDRNGLIGRQNRLPWRIQEDMDYFRSKTLNHTVIMGRRTWESIGKPLEQRTNIVLTNNDEYRPTGVIVCHHITEIDQLVGQSENFIIGGAKVFELYMPYISKIYLTRIDAAYEGDTYFPEVDLKQWTLDYYEEIRTSSGIAISFNEYHRI